MSQSPSHSINRTPQYIFLAAGAALIILLILLGTDVVNLDGPLVLIISSSLFALAMIAMAMELTTNRAGSNKADTTNTDA